MNIVLSTKDMCYYKYNDTGSFCGTEKLNKKTYKVFDNSYIIVENNKVFLKDINKQKIAYVVLKEMYTKYLCCWFPYDNYYKFDNMKMRVNPFQDYQILSVKIK